MRRMKTCVYRSVHKSERRHDRTTREKTSKENTLDLLAYTTIYGEKTLQYITIHYQVIHHFHAVRAWSLYPFSHHPPNNTSISLATLATDKYA